MNVRNKLECLLLAVLSSLVKCFSARHWGRLFALPTNISLGWQGLTWTNTPAHYELYVNYSCKKVL